MDDTKLFVRNLPYELDVLELEEFFSHFGPVSRVSLISDSSGNPRGFGFVKFPTAETCQAALLAFRSSGAEQIFKGRKVHAELASDPKLKGKRKTKGLPTSVREQQRQEQQEEVQERRRASKTAVTSSAVDARRVCVSLNDMHWPEEDEDGKERKKIYKKIKKKLKSKHRCLKFSLYFSSNLGENGFAEGETAAMIQEVAASIREHIPHASFLFFLTPSPAEAKTVAEALFGMEVAGRRLILSPLNHAISHTVPLPLIARNLPFNLTGNEEEGGEGGEEEQGEGAGEEALRLVFDKYGLIRSLVPKKGFCFVTYSIPFYLKDKYLEFFQNSHFFVQDREISIDECVSRQEWKERVVEEKEEEQEEQEEQEERVSKKSKNKTKRRREEEDEDEDEDEEEDENQNEDENEDENDDEEDEEEQKEAPSDADEGRTIFFPFLPSSLTSLYASSGATEEKEEEEKDEEGSKKKKKKSKKEDKKSKKKKNQHTELLKQQLFSCFQSFGDILQVAVHPLGKYAFIKFQDKETVEELLREQPRITVGGEGLRYMKALPKEQVPQERERRISSILSRRAKREQEREERYQRNPTQRVQRQKMKRGDGENSDYMPNSTAGTNRNVNKTKKKKKGGKESRRMEAKKKHKQERIKIRKKEQKHARVRGETSGQPAKKRLRKVL